MMLASEQLRVVPATIHIPLHEVPAALTPKKLETTIRITHAALIRDFGLPSPRLAVAGLNPHAGEGGNMGTEEIAWIGDETGLHNAMRVMARRGSFKLTIHYLDPFSPEEYRGRKAIAAKAREEIETQLVANLGKPLRDYQHVVEAVRYRPKVTGA